MVGLSYGTGGLVCRGGEIAPGKDVHLYGLQCVFVFFPVETIEIKDTLPVTAFGMPIPLMKPK